MSAPQCCSSGSASRNRPTSIPRSCPVASSSASPLREHWQWSQKSCSSTSRPPHWTRDDQRGPRRHDRSGRGRHDDGRRDPRDGLRPPGRQPCGVHVRGPDCRGEHPQGVLHQPEVQPSQRLPEQVPHPLSFQANLATLRIRVTQQVQRRSYLARGRPFVVLVSLIHISEPTRRTPISYAVFCLKKK